MATFDWTFDQPFVRPAWQIDGSGVVTPTEEIATHRTLTLSFRVTSDLLTTVLRPLKQNEGQVDTITTDSGGFVSVDRADGANTYTLTPPGRRTPLRQEADWHVLRYEEELVSQSVEEWNVEVEFVRGSNRTDTPSINEVVGAGEWGISTQYGRIATDRVDARFLGTGSDGVERFELAARLTMDQTHALEASLSRLAGTRVREIPDGENVAIDDSGGASTLLVESPTGGEVSSGDYVAMSWDSRRLNDAYQEVSLEIADTPDRQTAAFPWTFDVAFT